jgi:HAD superfamily hydrolase (TIGR01509 family)
MDYYEAILFDMDGVIIDTEQSVTAFWQKVAETYHVHLTQADFNQHIYGCPADHTFDIFFPHLDETERQSIFKQMAHYETNLTYTEMRGAVAFLRALKNHGIPTAIVTSGDRWKVSEVTRQLGIKEMFTVQVTTNDIQKGKPHPQCYLLAVQYLQKSPERCIVFEDSISGVKAAVASGALCIGIRPQNMSAPLLQAGARHVVPDFSSIRLLTYENQEIPLEKGGKAIKTALNLQIGEEYTVPLRTTGIGSQTK